VSIQLRFLLAIPPEQDVRFDRFSDSAGSYITLDSSNPAIYKQLYRAAKAKLKLRLRATVDRPVKMEPNEDTGVDQNGSDARKDTSTDSQSEPRHSFLETVLSQPLSNAQVVASFKSFQKTCPYAPTCAIPGAFDINAPGIEPVTKGLRDCHADLFSLPTLPSLTDFPSTCYTIDCNNCGTSVPDEHYHCGICENGDFDLCKACVDAGVACEGDEHWLLKRTIRNGVVIPSTTCTLTPKKVAPKKVAPKKASNEELPSSEEAVTPTSPEQDAGERTCNSCICRKLNPTDHGDLTDGQLELPAREFVTCGVCPDFDLCVSCFLDGDHGHDPSHAFEPQEASDRVNPYIKALCAPGRNIRHDAICDGCDKVSCAVMT
jgi:next-to-BRCA1 protein 1